MENLGKYKDSEVKLQEVREECKAETKYNSAVKVIGEEDYENVIVILGKSGDYRDGVEKLKEVKKRIEGIKAEEEQQRLEAEYNVALKAIDEEDYISL